MGAVLGGIGPVSVRYAAQIREMLYTQAVKKMVAEQEAARADAAAERAARLEAIQARNDAFAEEPVKVDPATVTKAAELAEPVRQPEAKDTPAPVQPAPVAPAQIFDEVA